MKAISQHMTYAEATHTNTGIANTPNDAQLANIKALAENVFEPLRKLGGNQPIRINSVFRSAKVNRAVGGASTSQHCANNGAAMDLDGIHITNLELGDLIKDNLDFDQLIYEGIDARGKIAWVHVSYKATGNRKQILIMRDGKYLPYNTQTAKLLKG